MLESTSFGNVKSNRRTSYIIHLAPPNTRFHFFLILSRCCLDNSIFYVTTKMIASLFLYLRTPCQFFMNHFDSSGLSLFDFIINRHT